MSLRLAIHSIYAQLDYEAAGDAGVTVRCDIDAALAMALYRGLAESPDRVVNVVVRTLSWALLSPACTAEDVSLVRAVASDLARASDGGESAVSVPCGSLRSLALNARRALLAHDPEAFALMVADFRATHLRGHVDRARAKRWQSWMDHIVMAPHGTTRAEVVGQLLELCQSDVVSRGLGGDTTYEPLLPKGQNGFGEVWRNGPNNTLQRCVLEACDVIHEGREMRVHIRVDPPLATPLAVEYLFEEEFLWRAFTSRYRDVRVIHYQVGGRAWSHVVG